MFRVLPIAATLLFLVNYAESAAAQHSNYALLYAFAGGADGAYPEGDITHEDGVLYGTTFNGGDSKQCANGCGTVFSLTLQDQAKSTVFSFQFKDGANPAGGVTAIGHLLYGTTFNGGIGHGTLFALNPAIGVERGVYSFAGGDDGANPASGVIAVGGVLYGTTQFGGGTPGTVFAFDRKTGAEHVAVSFSGPINGDQPRGSLTRAGGLLYGTTYGGGASGCGLVFGLNPMTGTSTLVYSFKCGTDSIGPIGRLLSQKGTLYGTSETGGTANLGTIFALDPATGAEKVIHSFAGGNDGLYPASGLIAAGGLLYGTTTQGGSAGKGTIFSINPVTGAETILHDFEGGGDGADPVGTMTNVGGTLYGTTESGGGSPNCGAGCGTVFAITP